MKKAIVIFLLSCMFSLYASTWEVVALGGKAAILKKGVWVDLQVGDTLENEDVITTYINSSLVIQKPVRDKETQRIQERNRIREHNAALMDKSEADAK